MMKSKKRRDCPWPISLRLHGEEEFRRVEYKVLERLLSEPPQVLATGGGAYLNPHTREMMRKNAVTVWLNADLETLVEARVTTQSQTLAAAPGCKAGAWRACLMSAVLYMSSLI